MTNILQRYGAYTIREASPADIEPAACIIFDAFNTFNASVGLPPEWPDLEFARAVVGSLINNPEVISWIATDEAEQVVASNFLDPRDFVGAPGPISIATAHQNSGLGRQLVQLCYERNLELGKKSFQFVQVGNNTKSFSLYVSAGFIPRQHLAAIIGFVDPKLTVPPDITVRKMEEGDVDACEALFQAAHGYTRRNDIRSSLHPMAPATPYVAVSKKDGHVMGYTTGLYLLGHAVCESEEVLRALLTGASHAMRAANPSGPAPLIHLPTLWYPDTLKWAFSEASLRMLRLETLMSAGHYVVPRQGVYCPGMAY